MAARPSYATPRPHAVTVLVGDAHAGSRSGVRLALEGEGFEVCAEAVDAAEAIAAARATRPDACLLDVDLPGDGIHAASEINVSVPGAAILMLTHSPDAGDLLRALRVGASGYLPKGMDPARLPFAVRGVLAGEAAIPRALVPRLIEELRGRRRMPAALRDRGVELTNREWEVLDMMRRGAGTSEMARALNLSPVTVRRHVSGVLAKLGAANRSAAVRILEEAS